MSAGTSEMRAVVVTRDESPDGPLSTHLRSLGLPVLLWPAVRIGAPEDLEPLRRALENAEAFDWIVFASRHGVEAVAALHPQSPTRARVAAVGEATARELRARGWRVDLVPAQPYASELVAEIGRLGCAGARVLFPASSRALPTIREGLTALGAEVLQIEAYRTEGAPLDVNACRDAIAGDRIGAVTFTSPSAAIELAQTLGREDFDRMLSRAPAVVLGRTTGEALAELGCTPVLAEPPTLEGLAATTYRIMQTRH